MEVRGEVLESAFIDLLGSIIPSKKAARRIRDSILMAYRERQKASRDESLVLDQEIKVLEQKVFNLHESFVVEQRITDADLYRKMLGRYQQEIAEKKVAGEELDQECTDISKLLDYAFGVLENARTLWLEGTAEQRQRLQRAVFPWGLRYEPSSGFGTPAVSDQFDVLGLFGNEDAVMAALRECSWKPLITWLKCFSTAREASA